MGALDPLARDLELEGGGPRSLRVGKKECQTWGTHESRGEQGVEIRRGDSRVSGHVAGIDEQGQNPKGETSGEWGLG